MNNPSSGYLASALKEFRYYKALADETINRLDPEQTRWQPNAQSNCVAVIMRHMSGNMLSRFTNFLTEDGEKSWRDRDLEFKTPSIIGQQASSDQLIKFKNDSISLWEEAWDILFNTITSLSVKQLETIVYIRKEPHTVVQAINRQIAHYAYHVGQIVFIGKCLVGNWTSLSIPPNGSKGFNNQKGMK